MREVAAEHKHSIVRYLVELGEQCGFANPQVIADQLNILIEGAIVTAEVVGQVRNGGSDPGAPARLAKEMTQQIVKMTDRK